MDRGNRIEIKDRELPPEPSYAPAAMAMGVMMLAWGILTHWTMSVVGAGLAGWALFDWINSIRKGWAAQDEFDRA